MVSNLLSPFMSQPGTYLYHAHYGMQREAGLYGMMRVAPRDPEPFAYDLDRSIILNDWYHSSTYEQAAGLSSGKYINGSIQNLPGLLFSFLSFFNCLFFVHIWFLSHF